MPAPARGCCAGFSSIWSCCAPQPMPRDCELPTPALFHPRVNGFIFSHAWCRFTSYVAASCILHFLHRVNAFPAARNVYRTKAPLLTRRLTLPRSPATLRLRAVGSRLRRLPALRGGARAPAPGSCQGSQGQQAAPVLPPLVQMTASDAPAAAAPRLQPSIALAQHSAATAQQICDLVNTAYRGERTGNWTTEAGLVAGPRVQVADVEQLLASSAAHSAAAEGTAARRGPALLVAELDGRLVGCIEVACTDAAQPAGGGSADGYLGMLSVDGSVAGRGLGAALMAAGEALAKEAFGATGVVLFVLSCRRDIIAWYSRRGYADTGLRQPAEELIAQCCPGQSKLLAAGADFVILRKPLV